MPAELFRTVVGRREAPGHRVGAIPVSLATHAVLLAAAITIPLLASDVLPRPPAHVAPPVLAMPVVTVPTAPRAYPARPVPVLPPAASLVPVVAPNGIGEEIGIVRPTTPPGDLTVVGTDVLVGSVPVGGLLDPTPPPPPPAKPAAPVPVRVVQPPRKLHHEAPLYPQAAVMARIEGTVTLEAVIATNGTVQELRVVKSVPLLDQAALDAVRRWTYTPTLLGGVPVPVIMTVQVEFRLAR